MKHPRSSILLALLGVAILGGTLNYQSDHDTGPDKPIGFENQSSDFSDLDLAIKEYQCDDRLLPFADSAEQDADSTALVYVAPAYLPGDRTPGAISGSLFPSELMRQCSTSLASSYSNHYLTIGYVSYTQIIPSYTSSDQTPIPGVHVQPSYPTIKKQETKRNTGHASMERIPVPGTPVASPSETRGSPDNHADGKRYRA